MDFTSAGLLELVRSRIDAHWLAHEFPVECPDHHATHIFATDLDALGARAHGLMPSLKWPLWQNRDDISDATLFDVVEFVGRYVAEPKAGASHPYYGHYTLTFNRGSGALAFRDDVNELLRAGGAAYSMVSNMTIERLVPEELSATLSALNPATGDDILDAAIERGRTLLRSRREDERLVALQTLWDAFEHVKTLDQPGQNQKKQSSEQLLSRVEPEQLRDEVRKDMLAVTDLGNRFRIRHHESHVPAVPDDSYDYFAGRITSLLLLLLRYSERLE